MLAPAGGDPGPFPGEALFPELPSERGLIAHRRLRALRRFVAGAWLIAPLALALFGLPRLVRAGGRLLDQIPFPDRDA
jgi:hypothetical protein